MAEVKNRIEVGTRSKSIVDLEQRHMAPGLQSFALYSGLAMAPVGDHASQAGRIIELLTNSDLHRSMAEAARKTATSRFCTDLIIPQYEAYYRKVCQSPGTGEAPAVSKVSVRSAGN